MLPVGVLRGLIRSVICHDMVPVVFHGTSHGHGGDGNGVDSWESADTIGYTAWLGLKLP